MRKALVIILLLAPTIALAQSDRIELTPSFGFRWGGKILAEDSSLLTHDVKLRSSETYGLNLGMPLGEHAQIELFVQHQSTELAEDSGLFAPGSGAVDVDVTYSHIGFLWQWPLDHADIAPFVATSLGVGHVSPNLTGARAEDRFSGSLGWGFKFRLRDNVGLRIEQRGFFTDLSGNNGDDHHDRHCDDWDECDSHALFQTSVTAGLVIRF